MEAGNPSDAQKRKRKKLGKKRKRNKKERGWFCCGKVMAKVMTYLYRERVFVHADACVTMPANPSGRHGAHMGMPSIEGGNSFQCSTTFVI